VALDSTVRATLHGTWGFDHYDGPSFNLVDARAQGWTLRPGEDSALIVGREDTVHLSAGNVSCVAEVALQDAAGKTQKLEWKGVKPDEAEVKLALADATPGDMTLLVRQYGVAQPQHLALHAYAESGRLDGFAMHAGDQQGVLRGTRLDKVQKLIVSDVEFTPGALTSGNGHDELTMQTSVSTAAAGLKPGVAPNAHVTFNDGRVYEVRATIDPPRPSAVLIGKSADNPSSGAGGNIRLGNQDELPQDARLTFSLRAQSPSSFSHDDKVEVATTDGAASTLLDFGSGSMQLETKRVAVATLDPAKVLGASAFGPLHYRVVSSGVAGDWRPLATLVRLPVLKRLECPGGASSSCRLSGANLFLIDSVAGDAQFSQPTPVPDGYTEQSLSVPRPTEGQLYVKLRDDPSVINVATIDVQVAAPPADSSEPPASDATKPAAAPTSMTPSAPLPQQSEAKASAPAG
jgi:hypothetical protein